MSQTLITEALAGHSEAIKNLQGQVETLEQMAKLLTASLRAGGKVLLFGNGGSAADAQHIAGEFLGRFRRERPAFAAVALSTDTSTITAIGNDYSFERIFARQVEGLVRERDVAWALSTSGDSANVVLGLEAARQRGAKTLAFSGGQGGRMAAAADICLTVKGKQTARIQEAHQLAYHILCDLVEEALTEGSRD